jgi:hypothetical protein
MSAGCPHPVNENRGLGGVVDAYSSPDEGVQAPEVWKNAGGKTTSSRTATCAYAGTLAV